MYLARRHQTIRVAARGRFAGSAEGVAQSRAAQRRAEQSRCTHQRSVSRTTTPSPASYTLPPPSHLLHPNPYDVAGANTTVSPPPRAAFSLQQVRSAAFPVAIVLPDSSSTRRHGTRRRWPCTEHSPSLSLSLSQTTHTHTLTHRTIPCRHSSTSSF